MNPQNVVNGDLL